MIKKLFKNNFSKNIQAGFSLLEVLIALGILGAMLTMIWSTQSQSIKTQRRAEQRLNLYHEASVTLKKLQDDLSLAFLVVPENKTDTSALAATKTVDAKTSPPDLTSTALLPPDQMQKKEYPVKTFFITKDGFAGMDIKLTSLSNVRMVADAKESDQCKISYTLKKSETVENASALYRGMDAYLDDSDKINSKEILLTDGVKSLKYKFYDDSTDEWVDEWDTNGERKNRLPKAVKAELIYVSPIDKEEEMAFTTSFYIPMYKGIPF